MLFSSVAPLRLTRSLPRACLLLVSACVAAAPGCRKQEAAPTQDAGRPAVVRVRPNPNPGELALDLTKSKLALQIIKDRDFKSPVTATLTLRDGALSLGAGSARLSVDLDSFDSGIVLRNERVRGIVFETAGIGWDTAELSIPKLPDDPLAALRAKKPVVGAKLVADLKVHGHMSKLAMVVDASYAPSGWLTVKSSEPVVVKLADLALTSNVKRLSQICMHDSIDDVVKIDVVLEFPPH